MKQFADTYHTYLTPVDTAWTNFEGMSDHPGPHMNNFLYPKYVYV